MGGTLFIYPSLSSPYSSSSSPCSSGAHGRDTGAGAQAFLSSFFPDSTRSLYSVYIKSPFVAFTNYGMSQI